MDKQIELVNRWTRTADEYDESIHGEMNSFKADAWKVLIEQHALGDAPLSILDVGTGPGFFPILLGHMGHRITAIDSSPGMIDKARENAQRAGVEAEFVVMDSHRLEFESATFDLIVSRNVVWTLHDPAQAYREWQRVLMRGGRLSVFDANWHLYQYDAALLDEVKRRDLAYRRRFGARPDNYYGPDAPRDESSRLLLHDQHRPSWDHGALSALGFVNIEVDLDISEHVWDESERLLYGATPMFMITAVKPTG
jgi:ubiquinone/menaquinone biosynthesis C-methylase UbiE